jgi:hypothetical protein
MITKLILKNFRGVEYRELTFGPNGNELRGPNEIGKTTTSDAIAFAFHGSDSTGDKSVDHLIRQGADECEVIAQTGKATFIRKKKRGGTSKFELARDGFPTLTMTQTELVALLGSDLDLFISSYHLGYFMGLTPAKQMEVIGQAVRLDRKALIEKHLPHTPVPWRLLQLRSAKTDEAAVARERRLLANQVAEHQGQINEIQAQLAQIQSTQGGEALEVLEQRQNEMKAKIAVIDQYRDSLRVYNSDLAKYGPANLEYTNAQSRMAAIQNELLALGEGKVAVPVDFESANAYIQTLQSRLLPKPAMPSHIEISENNCTRCGTLITPKMREVFQENHDQAILAFNEEDRRVETHNAGIRSQIEEANARLAQAQASFQQIQSEESERQIARARLTDELNRLGRIGEPIAPTPPAKLAVAETREFLSAASDKLLALIGAKKLMATGTDALTERLTEANRKIKDLNLRISDLVAVEGLLKRLPEIEMNEVLSTLSMPGVDFKLVDNEPRVMVGGVPYKSLSRGRRLKTDFQWCEKLQSIMKNAPGFYFCDDADLVDHFGNIIPKRAQVFFARVKADLKDMEVLIL